MKFTINSKALLSRLVAAGKAVSNRPSISILGNFMFALDGKTVTITASDTDNVVISRIEANDAEGAGSVCIDAKRVTELLKAMPDCPVVFDIDDSTHAAIIRYTNGKYNLSGLPTIDYPIGEADETEVKGVFTMPASQILKALDVVGFATSNDELRPMLNGVYWDITEDAVTFVATDTHVLAKYRSTQTAPGKVMSFNLPSKSIALIRAFIGKQSDIKLTVSERFVIFEGSDFKVRSTLYNGMYPNYNRVIPVNQPISITVDRMDFANAITRVAICADAQTPVLRLKIADGKIDIVAQDISFNIGGEEKVTCDYNGTPLEIGFSSTYLKGVLNAMNTQNIVIKLSDASRPGLFLPAENDEYGELTLLCMPMNIQTT